MNMDFSSWPRDQEQQFVVFEQRQQESHRKASRAAIIASVAFLVLALGVYAGVEPEHKDMTKGMNMENLTKKSKKVEPAPAPAPAPAAAAPEAAAPEAPAAESK
jgi:flagellar biosynthesis/type III secretory pathway M-ring protein FliF/YscJ